MVLEYFKQLLDVWRSGRLIDDVHVDVRTEEEKSRDYIYGLDIQLPRGGYGKRIKKLPFEAYDQQRTLACGAYAASHARRLETKEENYPLAWYRTRSNFPAGGMFIKEVLELIAYAKTFPFPKKLPAKLTEAFANAMALEPAIVTKDRSREYFSIKPYDADGVFDAVNNGFPVLLAFYSTTREWAEEMIPTDTVWINTAAVRHYVIAIPNSFHNKDGHEWVSVVDSARQGGLSLRHVRKDFLQKRMYLGAGFVRKAEIKKAKLPDLPTQGCQYGQRNSAVLALQKYLVSQSLMEERHTTGYYGNVTAAAVLRWQLDNIQDVNYAELVYLEGKHWGPLSVKAVINKHP
jgi:hypothetical protein